MMDEKLTNLEYYINIIPEAGDEELVAGLRHIEVDWDKVEDGTAVTDPFNTVEEWVIYYDAIEEEVIKRGLEY